ncbi:hypothetical protein [Streptomyces sp. NPDC054865]
MTAPPADGVDVARAHLAEGRAVVLPNPAPLTYVVAATSPYAVNRAKGPPTNNRSHCGPTTRGPPTSSCDHSTCPRGPSERPVGC